MIVYDIAKFLENEICEMVCFDGLGSEKSNTINKEYLSFYNNREKILENDLKDLYLNDFIQSKFL